MTLVVGCSGSGYWLPLRSMPCSAQPPASPAPPCQESYDFSLDELGGGAGRGGAASSSASPSYDGGSAAYTVDVTDVLEEWGLLTDGAEKEFEQWKDRVVAAARRHGKVRLFSERFKAKAPKAHCGAGRCSRGVATCPRPIPPPSPPPPSAGVLP